MKAMRQSDLFTKTFVQVPKEELSVNAQLLIRGGYIDKLMSGVYTYLYLGWRVLKKIENIIREEMDSLDGQEIFMPALQPKNIWEKTGRWDELSDIMYQFDDRSNHPIGLATTHEEVLTEIIKKHIKSYRDLPKYIYQIQNKYRNEPRAKSGLVRGREFLMKDLYSFHTNDSDLNKYYEKVKTAYLKIFKRCNLDVLVIEASGGAFTKKYSHEFTALSSAGEDNVIYCSKCDFAQNAEIAKLSADNKCPDCRSQLKQSKGIEVGNIFKLGTRFSEKQGAFYSDRDGKSKPIFMACYGIGLGRLMGTIVEIFHDKDGIIWPETVAPFQAHLLKLGENTRIGKKSELFYQSCQKKGIDILFDDRNISAGQKLKDSDLLGIPHRLVISEKTGDKIEYKLRSEKSIKLISYSQALKILTKW